MKISSKFWIWLMSILLGAVVIVIAFRLDPTVEAWQRKHRWKNIQVLSRNVTRLTDWPLHIVIGLAGAGIAWRSGNKKWQRVFLAMIASCVIAGISAYALKMSTGRVRPYVKVEKVWSGPTARQNFHSFPSGHTAGSFGFFAVLFFVSWRLALICLPLPFFVGFTRIFLGAHYFSDVVAAAVLGILCAAMVATFMLQAIRSSQSTIRN